MNDKRLIEDYIPIEAINEVAQREKIGHAAHHPRKLHLWWARRPLAAARAAVYATLIPASEAPSRDRADAFFRVLCSLGISDRALAEVRAQVVDGTQPPRVLDLFAGGGAIPLEAQRLGAAATAVELNPVAHLIERATLEFPQRFGRELGDDIRRYGESWIQRTWDRVGHLYPRLREEASARQTTMTPSAPHVDRSSGRPFAYLWTRTVPCPNPERDPHAIPLVRQTWLAKKKGQYTALRPVVDRDRLTVAWEVVQAATAEELNFDPTAFSKRGSTSCLVCGASVDSNYVKAEGLAGRMGIMPLAAVLVKAGGRRARLSGCWDIRRARSRRVRSGTGAA